MARFFCFPFNFVVSCHSLTHILASALSSFHDRSSAAYPNRSYYGAPNYECGHCAAVFWYSERIVNDSSYTQQRIVYTLCCHDGRVSLPKRRSPPSPLRDLLSLDGHAHSRGFMRLIRQYNSLFAFTSLGVDVDRSINTGGGPYVFRINGVVHHQIGSLVPEEGRRPEYAQLYIHDTSNELQNRLNIFSGQNGEQPDPDLVAALIAMFDQCNPFVTKFRMARDRLLSPAAPDISVNLIGTVDAHGDRYSVPSVPELAGLVVGGVSAAVSQFDVVVETRASQFKQISPVHPALMALQYPLLFPYGEHGFHTGIKLKPDPSGRSSGRENVTMMEYYCYYMHYRKGEPNPEICSGRLSQQFEVNAFSCLESSRLSYHYFNQDRLRCETFQGISDAIYKGSSAGRDVGVKKTLPASFIGSKRYMQQNYHDCLAICCVYGPPDIFTTFTCNSKWPEILEAISFEPGHKPHDRGDMVSRVFHMKLHEYLQDIRDSHFFGPVCAGPSNLHSPLFSFLPTCSFYSIQNYALPTPFVLPLQLHIQLSSKNVACLIRISLCGSLIAHMNRHLLMLIITSPLNSQTQSRIPLDSHWYRNL